MYISDELGQIEISATSSGGNVSASINTTFSGDAEYLWNKSPFEIYQAEELGPLRPAI